MHVIYIFLTINTVLIHTWQQMPHNRVRMKVHFIKKKLKITLKKQNPYTNLVFKNSVTSKA